MPEISLEKALRSPKTAKRLQGEVSDKVNRQKGEVSKAMKDRELMEQATRIIREATPERGDRDVKHIRRGGRTPIRKRGEKTLTKGLRYV